VINIKYYSENKNHYFEVEDNGIGIAQNYHDQIFEMFKRLNDREKFNGPGMGLSIANKLIERIDGKISVLCSNENEGSTLLFSFPLVTVENDILETVEY